MTRAVRTAVLAAVLAACAGPRTPPPAPAPGAPAPSAAAPAPAAPAGPDRTSVPPAGPPPDLRVPAQVHFTLSNGLRVRLVEYDRLPIVALNLVVEAGAVNDPPGRPGLASMTAEMMNEGTRTRTATQISDEVGFLGASLNAMAGFDAASLVAASLSRHLPKLAEIFADVAMNPTFPPKDFRRVQDERLVALLQQKDQPPAVAGKAFAEAFWGKHPYGHWLIGTEPSVKAMTPRELSRFHARNWVPANAELVVVGDVRQAELAPVLERTLGRWRVGTPTRPPAAPAPAGRLRTVVIEKDGAPQAYLQLGMPGLARSSPDFVAAQVAFQVLGGGTSSRLFRNLREAKGYTYGIGSRADARRLAGSSLVAGSVKAESTGEAIRDILEEVRTLREALVPERELADAKDAIVLGMPAGFATAGGIAGHLAELVVHDLPDGYWNAFADEVRAVTAEQVRSVARRVLDPSRLTLVMVAETDVVRPQLEGLPIGPPTYLPSPAAAPPGPAKPGRAPASVR
jgi:predicted Zn-dependent peptidase